MKQLFEKLTLLFIILAYIEVLITPGIQPLICMALGFSLVMVLVNMGIYKPRGKQ